MQLVGVQIPRKPPKQLKEFEREKMINDFVVYKSEADNQGRLVELVHNKHCEVYEVIVDGIPVFNCND